MASRAKGLVTAGLALVYGLLSVFHVIGAFGAWRSLAVIPTIPGEPAHYPAPLSWLGVAGMLALASLVILARGDVLLRGMPTFFSTFACVVLGAVLVWRTIGEFRFFGLFRSVTGTSFAYWDTWLYTPLCLVLGLTTLWLASTPRALPGAPTSS